MNKWTKAFWVDLAERVGATFLGAVLGLLTLSGTTTVDWTNWNYIWTVVGLPVAFSLLKGLLANLKDPESGASMVDAPPGPVLENGATDILYAAGAALVLLAVVLLVTTLLKAFVVSWIVIIVFAVVGLFLLFWRSGGVRL
jgi:ABC-type amino acid transport system permease subunit